MAILAPSPHRCFTTRALSGGIVPRKNYENVQTAMAILMLFEQFLRKVYHIFGP